MAEFAAIVTDNNDPEQLGRLLLEIPGILGSDDPEHPDWIAPRVAAAGPGAAGFLFVPPIGAAVYVHRDDDGSLRWYGADFGALNTIPADLRVNYPGRSGFSSPGTAADGHGRHVIALDDVDGFLAIVEDDTLLDPGPRSYLAIKPDGTATIGGARGGFFRLTPEEIALLSAGGHIVQLADGGSVIVMHSGGTEYVELADGVAKLSGTATQVYGGTIDLGGGSVPPTHPFILSTAFLGALQTMIDALVIELAKVTPAGGGPLVTTALVTLSTAIGTSLASGAPYLSTRTKGD